MKRTATVYQTRNTTPVIVTCVMTDKFYIKNKRPARLWVNEETGKQYGLIEHCGKRYFIEK